MADSYEYELKLAQDMIDAGFSIYRRLESEDREFDDFELGYGKPFPLEGPI